MSASIDRKSVKRPRRGDVVICKFGDCTVVEVKYQGLVLRVQTPVHGTEILERSCTGWWSVRPS